MILEPAYGHDLNLLDFAEGDYEFRVKCRHCHHEWREYPKEVLNLETTHPNMYLDEIEKAVECLRCHRKNTRILIIKDYGKHAWIGGMP